MGLPVTTGCLNSEGYDRLLSLSSHKFHAPRGGIRLVANSGLVHALTGGGQEQGQKVRDRDLAAISDCKAYVCPSEQAQTRST